MWYTATSASVTNGADVVAITTGDDISIIQEDSGLIFEGESPVQVKRGYIDGSGEKFIQLQSPWPYTSKTNQPLVSFPTDASFAEATAELRRVIDTLSVASTTEAQAGTDDEKIMTPLKTKQAIDFNTGTAASKDIVTSVVDSTAGRLLTVNYGGIGPSAVLVSDFNNLTTVNGCYQSLLGNTTGAPVAGRQYTLWHNAFGTGTGNDRAAQIAVESLPTTSISPMYFRTREVGVWGEWREIYHSGNTNFNEFAFNQNETKNGMARNASEVVIELPINSKVDPVSISTTGTFYVVNEITSVTEATGVAPIIIGSSSQRNLIVVLSSSNSFTKGNPYTAVAETGGVTIEVNY